jgi:hypothetical protein
MSGQNGPDEAARLELALARIARAAARRAAPAGAIAGEAGALQDEASRATKAGGLDTAEIAARLDRLIAELRALLAPQEF